MVIEKYFKVQETYITKKAPCDQVSNYYFYLAYVVEKRFFFF